MRFWAIFTLFSILGTSAHSAEALATVVLVRGTATIRHGEIMAQPKSDGTADVRFHDSYEHALSPNDALSAGDIVISGNDTMLKLYGRDDTIIDVGPNSILKIERGLAIQLAAGKIHLLLSSPSSTLGPLAIATATGVIRPRGTDFVVRAYAEKNRAMVQVASSNGMLIAELTGHPKPIAINAGQLFTAERVDAKTAKFSAAKAKGDQLENFSTLAAAIEDRPGGAAALPVASRIPGTGLVAGARKKAPERSPAAEPADPKALRTTTASELTHSSPPAAQLAPTTRDVIRGANVSTGISLLPTPPPVHN